MDLSDLQKQVEENSRRNREITTELQAMTLKNKAYIDATISVVRELVIRDDDFKIEGFPAWIWFFEEIGKNIELGLKEVEKTDPALAAKMQSIIDRMLPFGGDLGI